MQSDPIGLNGGINIYAYVDGDPVANIDLLGLWYFQIGFTQQGSSGVGVAHDTGAYIGSGKGGVDFGYYGTGTVVGGTNVGFDVAGALVGWSKGDVANLSGNSGGWEAGLDALVIDAAYGQEYTNAGDTVHNLTLELSVDASVTGPVSMQSTINKTKTVSVRKTLEKVCGISSK